jgi:hypothetical protein
MSTEKYPTEKHPAKYRPTEHYSAKNETNQFYVGEHYFTSLTLANVSLYGTSKNAGLESR